MKTRLLFVAATLLAFAVVFSACSQQATGMRDGYYSAEGIAFDAYGWKECMTIYVSGNRILTVEYDAYNASGFVRSWDINYMRTMNLASGTYPNAFTRSYAVSLLNWQNPAEVDAVTGATDSHASFRMLSEAAIAKARAGDKRVALVDLSAAYTASEG